MDLIVVSLASLLAGFVRGVFIVVVDALILKTGCDAFAR
jgi:hypothetical protein